MSDVLLVDGFVPYINDFSFLADYLAVTNLNGCLCYFECVARRVHAERVVDSGVALGMVVTEEDDVEALYGLRHLPGNIFLVGGGDNAAIPSAMEKSDDDICLLLLLQNLQPVAGGLEHLVEAQARPQALVQPVGNGGREHA